MKRLPLAYECLVAWEAMRGTTHARHCAACDRTVYDLSAKTELEATALLALAGARGPMCVRFAADRETGAVAFRAARAPTRVGRHRGVAAPGLLVAALGVGACSSTRVAEPTTIHVVAATAEHPARSDARLAVATRREATAPRPATDTDLDTIPDAEDACPREAGTADNRGCPATFMGVLADRTSIAARIAFARGAARVAVASTPLLAAIAQVLATHPEFTRVVVRGHASADEPNALALSRARARQVVVLLAAQGDDPARLVATATGDTRPIETNLTATGRAANRRVDFEVDATGSP